MLLATSLNTSTKHHVLEVGIYRYGFTDYPPGSPIQGSVLWLGPWGAYAMPASAATCYVVSAAFVLAILWAVSLLCIRHRKRLASE
jgi:hypothetical protein